MLSTSGFSTWIVRASSLGGGLRPRIVGLAESPEGPAWFAALVEDGHVQMSGEAAAIAGPSLVWRPWPRGSRATFRPGTTGAYALMGPGALAAALPQTDAGDLEGAVRAPVTIRLDDNPDGLDAMRAAFASVLRETASGRPAARSVVEAQLRVVLVEVFRASLGLERSGEGAMTADRMFSRFISLIERNFRDRWTVQEYAAALGTTRDRLGDICRRTRGKTAKELIDRRVAIEAREELARTSKSVEQVALGLGFSSSAQFSRFFRRLVLQPPGVFRSTQKDGSGDGDRAATTLHDWP